MQKKAILLAGLFCCCFSFTVAAQQATITIIKSDGQIQKITADLPEHSGEEGGNGGHIPLPIHFPLDLEDQSFQLPFNVVDELRENVLAALLENNTTCLPPVDKISSCIWRCADGTKIDSCSNADVANVLASLWRQ